MDGRDFDALARSVAGGGTRRGLLRAGLALAGAALGLGGVAATDASTGRRQVGSPCVTNSHCATGVCGPAGARRKECQCVSAADCPVSTNPCAVATCSAGVCGQTITVGASCVSGNLCRTGETCQANGTCGAGISVVCDDGNACTTDTCEPAIGCVHTPKNCPAPDSLCQVAVCDPQTGECGVADKNCDDGYSCTKDSCNSTNGECVNTYVVSDFCPPPGRPCTTFADCDQPDPCVFVDCVAGACQRPVFLPVGTACSTGDPCITGETCQAGSRCGGGTEVACT